MARIHPSFPLHSVHSQGEHAERIILKQLEQELPDSYDIFHNLPWSSLQNQHTDAHQSFGEIDVVVLSPLNQLLAIEIKAGQLEVINKKLIKLYKSQQKDALDQAHRNRNHLIKRLESINRKITVNSLLVLPDYQVISNTLAYPREFIVDATQMGNLGTIVKQSFNPTQAAITQTTETREKLINFLSDKFEVTPDVSSRIGHIQQSTIQLASGLATWVPKIKHTQNVYCIEATAGSGKTQLALALLRQAAQKKLRACYICFNRSLADHMTELAPPMADVFTFHQICHAYAEKLGQTINFLDSSSFKIIEDQYIKAHEANPPQTYDLLILDESQDFEPVWVNTLSGLCKYDGSVYLMGDRNQQIFPRESFDLENAVHIDCMDNFRSPQKVVQAINQLNLTSQSVVARSVFMGRIPDFYSYNSTPGDHTKELNKCLKQLWEEGFKPSQVAVLSFNGASTSNVLKQSKLGGYETKRPNGFDTQSNALWTDGELLVDTIYRFKGQSSPVIVLCEVDFDIYTDKEKRKLFVGFTRCLVELKIVLSERSAQLLMQ
jgi:superfamily I DNA and RNA helicase